MRFGTGYSLTALADIGVVRDFAQALDGAGFDFVGLAGHVLSLPPERFPDRNPGTFVGPFRDPFVLFAYLSGLTSRLSFRTSILILPLFPTPLLARQAADLAIVSGGRFELGVGISWNEYEYQAMGQDIHTRGRRLEEQIVLLKRLWTEPYVTFEGRWHHLDGVGLNQLPPRPVPVLIGCGTEDALLRRVARLGDGWLPQVDPTEPMQRLRRFLIEEGRDIESFSLTGRLVAGPEGPDGWIAEAKRLQEAGVTDLNLSAPPGMPPAESMARIIEAREALAAAL